MCTYKRVSFHIEKSQGEYKVFVEKMKEGRRFYEMKVVVR